MATIACAASNGHSAGVYLPKNISLEDAIMLALRNNPEVQSARLQRVIDRFSLEVARNEFEPKYTLSSMATYSRGNKPDYRTSPGVSLKSPFGTEFTLDSEWGIGGDSEVTAGFTVKQPLLRGAGSRVTLIGLENAYDTEVANKLTFKDRLITTITNVITSYNTLVQDYNRLEIDKLSLEDSQRTLKQTKLRIKAGKEPPTALTQQEAQVESQKLTIVTDKNTILSDYQKFLVLLGLSPDSKLEIDKTIRIDFSNLPAQQESIDIAFNNNIDYLKDLINFGVKNRDLLLAKDAQRWQLDLTAKVDQNLKNPNVQPSSRTVTVDLTIPLDDKPRQKQLVDAEVGLRQFEISLENRRRTLKTEVINAWHTLKAQQQQIALAENTVKFSRESLRIAQRKFEFGRATIFEVTSLRDRLTRDENNLVNQKISYLNTLAQFEKTLGVSLLRWKVGVIY